MCLYVCVKICGEQKRDLWDITVMLMLFVHNAPSESVMLRSERNLLLKKVFPSRLFAIFSSSIKMKIFAGSFRRGFQLCRERVNATLLLFFIIIHFTLDRYNSFTFIHSYFTIPFSTIFISRTHKKKPNEEARNEERRKQK